jgi:predicted membrane channel-forming protein YqfA (hemolysin III family)
LGYVCWTWVLNDITVLKSVSILDNEQPFDKSLLVAPYALSFTELMLAISNVFGNVIPIFLSAFCHHFYCINKKWHSMCWFLDFLGILTGMFCSGVGFAYLSFYCTPSIMHCVVYGMVVAYILAIQICYKKYLVRTSVRTLRPADRFPEFSLVLSTFGALATASPVVVVVLTLQEYTAEASFRTVLLESVLFPSLVALGIVCFAQGNFPEKFAEKWGWAPPHFFDYVGHSHQWWHLLSAGLQFGWIELTRRHYLARMAYGCPNI